MDYQTGVSNLSRRLAKCRSESLKPPPRLTISEWANRYAYLSPETSAEPGRFRSFGYQNGILDAVCDPSIAKVTVIKSARVGYTKCLDHIVGYFIHQDPSPILAVQPRVEDAEDYSKSEIAPMLRDTPVLAAIVGDLKAKDSNQRILKRTFRNGSSIAFVGANSPGGFRRITARVILFDEVDGFPVDGAGQEGDQIALGTKRSETFWNRKIVLGSTPTIKGKSRIEKSWEESDQRRYYVPCPHCGHEQVLRWENLHWDKETDENGNTLRHKPETAYFLCSSGNGCVIDESAKPKMIAAGRWIAEKPSNGHAGFHIWAAYSLFANAAWRFLIEEFLRVRKDPSLLQTFVNLVLGETWEEQGEIVDASSFMARREVYDDRTIPAGALIATAGVDTQGDRLEAQIVTFGRNEESWTARYVVLHGDPAQMQVWKDLDQLLLEPLATEDGRTLRVRACCIDSGGNHTAAVLAYCRTRRARRIFPTAGMAGPKPIWPQRASRTKTNDQVFMIGVDTAKDQIYARLRIAKPGPGYVHFPVLDAFDEEYFAQLTSEKVVTRYRKGRPYRVWEPMRKRNEALDTFVLNMAALKSLPIRLDAVPRTWTEADAPPLPEPPKPTAPTNNVFKPVPDPDDTVPEPRQRADGRYFKQRQGRRVARSKYMG